ncbi:hypothetical protein [Pantoea wallisii]|nr:hypothetical protein [Pantoea wallisii]
MKKLLLSVGVAAALMATAAYAGFAQGYGKPDYVVSAAATTNNFLKYSYGPGKCEIGASPQQAWDMVCSYDNGDRLIKYTVHPVNQDLRRNADKFYLEAQNALAVESAKQGLSRYLDIRTTEIKGA